MQRTILTIIMALITAIVAVMFILLNLSIDAIFAIITSGNVKAEMMNVLAPLFAEVITPFTEVSNGIYTPLAVLGITGFIAGLISKSGTRVLVSIVALLVIFFLGFIVLNGLGPLEVETFKNVALGMKADLTISFFVLFMSGVIGASFTTEGY